MIRFTLRSPTDLEASVDRAQAVVAALGAPVEKAVEDDAGENFVSLHILKDGDSPEKRLVYGEVLIPEEWDNQQDIVSEEEIEKASHRFLEEFQTLGFSHKGNLSRSDARVVQSYIAPCDLVLNDRPIKKGTWVLVTKVYNDALWEAIRSGEINGYSVGGKADVYWADQEFNGSHR